MQIEILACRASPNAWVWLLETFYGYCCPLEAALFSSPGCGEWLPDSHLRLKSVFLSRDIEMMGGDTRRVPICPQLPRLNWVAYRFRSLYVVEGATLGARSSREKSGATRPAEGARISPAMRITLAQCGKLSVSTWTDTVQPPGGTGRHHPLCEIRGVSIPEETSAHHSR